MPVNVWHEHFMLSDLWEQFEKQEKPFEQVRDEIVVRFRAARFYDPLTDRVLAGLVDYLAESTTLEEFNRNWQQVYYWADDNRVWLCTVAPCPDCGT